jgi:hypothetical protein
MLRTWENIDFFGTPSEYMYRKENPMDKKIDYGFLGRVRTQLKELGRDSHTTQIFQDNLIDFIIENRDKGKNIIEVGCYKGGLTAQLAWVAKELGVKVDVIDIDNHYLNVTAETVNLFGLNEYVRFHACDLTTFVRNSPTYEKPIVAFIDGDHRYQGVVEDIRAIQSFPIRPYSAVFHDFSLRYSDGILNDVRVDRAILDEFGDLVHLRPIGEIAGRGTLRTLPAEDRHFHEEGQPEGVIVIIE